MKIIKRFLINCYLCYRYRKILSVKQYIKFHIASKSKKEKPPVAIILKNYPHPFWIRPGTSDTTIFKGIFLQQEYPIIQNKTGTIIDAGANIGATSFFFKMHAPKMKIIAVEPDESNCKLFELNMKPFSSVTLLKKALHNVEGRSMQIKNPDAPKYSYQMELGESNTKTVSINSILEKYEIKKLNIVKLDIEGGEKAVFEKNTEWINVCDILIIELHEHYAPGYSSALLRAISNYEVTINWQGENLIIAKSDYENISN
ncbi:MAG: FkbM family methyltransferase [Bacteroidales bacterium]